MTIIINNNTTTSVLFLFAATLSIMIIFVSLFPAIPEQGEIIVQSPGDPQRQQYYVKIRP